MRLVAIGGSDAGVSAALRARELDVTAEVTVIVADAYPNFSICGIPYHVSGEVPQWRNLAHRTVADLEETGMRLQLDTTAERIDAGAHEVHVRSAHGSRTTIPYDQLVVGTGALPVRPPIEGLQQLGVADGVHVLHSMDDTFALMRTLTAGEPRAAVIIGAGYLGLEMAEALTARGIAVTQVEQLPEVLPTVDPELGGLVAAELRGHGVDVVTRTVITRITRSEPGAPGRLRVDGLANDGEPFARHSDVVLVFAGVRPDVELAAAAGARLGVKGAIDVDRTMRTTLHDVFAAGDCVVTHHRLLGVTYIPLGTTAHKQGYIAGEKRDRRPSRVRRQPWHPGGEGVRHGGGPDRAPRPRGCGSRIRPRDHHRPGRRPQGVLPGLASNRDALDRRPAHRAAARRAALRPPPRGGGQAH